MKKNFTKKVQLKIAARLIAFSVLAVCTQAPEHALASNSIIGNINQQQETISISGVVKDATDGTVIPGVTISDINRKVYGATDGNGAFIVKVAKGSELVFNMIGYTSMHRVVNENQQNLTINLTASSNELNEVVVTALGIKREEKSLGYSITKVEGKSISDAPSNNWSDALKGKVPGLNLTQGGSGPLNSTRINLRGDRSLKPNGNDALIVIDGVPMTSGIVTSGVNDAYGAVSAGNDNDIPIDFGNGVSDLNPDDIESVTVLKGAAAAALYGSRANNGALIITTKSGKARKNGIGVSFNSNTSYNDILKWPDYQYEYGNYTIRMVHPKMA
jgi:TonB-dependent SusC/RagA subfamily outer membrane receptor